MRDFIAASTLFIASAAVVLWQNAHLAVLWDTSYILDTAFRISLGQTPYLIQAALIRFGGRVFFHHVLCAAVVGGLGTVLAWRIALETLRGRLRTAWAVSLLLAAPLTVLGIYSILPFPFYDSDCVFCILVVIFLLQRVSVDDATASSPARTLLRPFVAGVALPLPLFFKQNIGLPLLLAALALVLLLMLAKRLRGKPASQHGFGVVELGWILAGAAAILIAAGCLLHFTVGVGNYLSAGCLDFSRCSASMRSLRCSGGCRPPLRLSCSYAAVLLRLHGRT